MGEIKFITGIALFIIFVVAILGFATNFSSDNNSVLNISGDNQLNKQNTLTGGLDTFKLDVNQSAGEFAQSAISEGDSTTRTGGQFKVGLPSLFSSLSEGLGIVKNKIFGDSPAFFWLFTFFTSILVSIGIRYVWKTWKGGNPD